MPIKSLSHWSVTLAANGFRHYDITGDFITILEADSDLSVSFDGLPPVQIEKGISIVFEGIYTSFDITDVSGGSNVIEFYAGFNRIEDKRFIPTEALPAPPTFDSLADVTLANAATTVILAADSTRREAIISNTGSATVRIGDTSAAAANGIPLAANATIILDTQGAISGRNDTGGAIVVAVSVTQE